MSTDVTQEPSEQDWEAAAIHRQEICWTWRSASSADRRMGQISQDWFYVTREEALAEMRQRTEITVSDAETGAAWAEWCSILRKFDFDHSGKGIADFSPLDMHSILLAAKRAESEAS